MTIPQTAKHGGNFVAYYRVSTQRQGRSGLGLEAQQEAVRNYLNGGDWRIVTEFTEVESGKRKDRPKLADALAACRVHGAKLIIAKLDRLSRNVAWLALSSRPWTSRKPIASQSISLRPSPNTRRRPYPIGPRLPLPRRSVEASS